MPDMLEDAALSMQWVFTNIHFFGGDPDNVTLVGQSAGAHIASNMLIVSGINVMLYMQHLHHLL